MQKMLGKAGETMTIVERRRFFKAKDKYTKEWDVHFLPDIFKFGVEDADTDTICYATGQICFQLLQAPLYVRCGAERIL